jgi:demethylmenaquinone methyltransferase/2-methoxy-6-polyprenyl-1,4-benzoquinol methylase
MKDEGEGMKDEAVSSFCLPPSSFHCFSSFRLPPFSFQLLYSKGAGFLFRCVWGLDKLQLQLAPKGNTGMSGFDHFDFLAPLYERFIPPKDPQKLWALLDLPAAGALLDAGGGTGRMAQFMTGKAHPVVVADFSRKMLGQARLKDGIQAVCSQTEKLPFAAETFSRILMVDALHHLHDQQAAAAEMWRTLQAGGRLVIEEPDLHSPAVKLVALAEKLALMRSHFLPPERIAQLFPYSNARVEIEKDSFTAWIIVEKM